MAAKKPSVPADEKLSNVDFDLFGALEALDRKNYGYFSQLTEEQQRKFVPYMMTLWMSAIKDNTDIGSYYLLSTNEYANKHLFNEHVKNHPELQWLMLCAASPGMGKKFHQWVPHISDAVVKLDRAATRKEITEYFTKIYKTASKEQVQEIADAYTERQNKLHHLGKLFPEMKQADLETLSAVITDQQIEEYEREFGE